MASGNLEKKLFLKKRYIIIFKFVVKVIRLLEIWHRLKPYAEFKVRDTPPSPPSSDSQYHSTGYLKMKIINKNTEINIRIPFKKHI